MRGQPSDAKWAYGSRFNTAQQMTLHLISAHGPLMVRDVEAITERPERGRMEKLEMGGYIERHVVDTPGRPRDVFKYAYTATDKGKSALRQLGWTVDA